MNVPFTLEQLLQVFEDYNLAIWPLQVFSLLFGLAAVYFAIRPTNYSNRLITAILAFFWLSAGVGFGLLSFSQIYTPAYGSAGLNILQGILFLVSVYKPRLSFRYKSNGYSFTGLVMIAYAILGYPLIGTFLGHNYPQSMPFGLAPCPVTVFTFGLYLLTDQKIPKLFLVIPLIWALGGIMPVSIGILEDIGLIITGLVATSLILFRDRQSGELRSQSMR